MLLQRAPGGDKQCLNHRGNSQVGKRLAGNRIKAGVRLHAVIKGNGVIQHQPEDPRTECAHQRRVRNRIERFEFNPTVLTLVTCRINKVMRIHRRVGQEPFTGRTVTTAQCGTAG